MKTMTFITWASPTTPADILMIHPCQVAQWVGVPIFPFGPHGQMVLNNAIENSFPVPRDPMMLEKYVATYMVLGLKVASSVSNFRFNPDTQTIHVDYEPHPEFKTHSHGVTTEEWALIEAHRDLNHERGAA